MNKTILYNIEGRDALRRGVDIVANAVKVTLGPKGRNVIIEHQHLDDVITKDGVTVARSIFISDPVENIGAQLIKKVAERTVETAGDGTTTATVLAQAILIAGTKNVAAGANPMDLKKGIDKAVELVVENLKKQSVLINDDIARIRQIATLSANGDEHIGTLIADAVNKVGPDGVITIEEAKGTETSVNIIDGLQFRRGWISPFFVNKPDRMETELLEPTILIVNKTISDAKKLIPIVEKAVLLQKPLLIICDDLIGDALTLLVHNRTKNNMPFAAVRAPGHAESMRYNLQDLAIVTGATVISDESGYVMETAPVDVFGSAAKVTIGRDFTTIIGGNGSDIVIKNRVDELKFLIEESDNEFEEKKLRERLAKISAKIGVIYVGAPTEVEMKEKMDRVDDALHATKAAIEEGMVAGGGVALIRAIDSLKDLKGINEDENTGIQIIRTAIEEPMRQICINSGVEGSIVVQKVKEGKKDFGYNARTGQYEKLIAAGVIDPTKVTRICIENAASIASMLLTTECVIAIDRSGIQPLNAQPNYQM